MNTFLFTCIWWHDVYVLLRHPDLYVLFYVYLCHAFICSYFICIRWRIKNAYDLYSLKLCVFMYLNDFIAFVWKNGIFSTCHIRLCLNSSWQAICIIHQPMVKGMTDWTTDVKQENIANIKNIKNLYKAVKVWLCRNNSVSTPRSCGMMKLLYA